MSLQPQPVVIQVVQTTGPRTYENYNATAAKVLGIMQIVLAVLSIVFSAVAISIKTQLLENTGPLFPCAIFWIITGSIGITSGFRKSACMIIATMVLTILCAIGIPGYVASMSVAIVSEESKDMYDSDECGCFEEYDDETNSTMEICVKCVPEEEVMAEYRGKMAMVSLLLIIGVAEFIVAITASVLCCRAICCCRNTQNHSNPKQNSVGNQDNQVVVVKTENGPQHVTLPTGYQVVNPATSNSMSPPPPYTIDSKY